MSDPNRRGVWTDRTHVFISGITGSASDMGGKTSTANWWLCEPGKAFDLRVFFNAKGSSAVRGERVSTVQDLAQKMREGVRHFDFVPATADWEAHHDRLAQFVAELPRSMSKLVVHDEAPELGDSLLRFVRIYGQEDGVNCKSLVIAQSPTDIKEKSVIKQCPAKLWVGPTSEDYRHWFRANGMSNHYETIAEARAPYHLFLMEGTRDEDLTLYAPVPEAYA
ncbi:hypothetical protein [Halomarina oriensis]|uniref:ATP-binding protein n=1 Tax=Halomarina oriensis TaxID=671145 RepID=A0A6B0GPX5_9EURY|nr:hypothetical protein [Halomarina oriensis]MWG34165.1 hypothetical protein [Halomarina oriensis]